MHKNLGSCPTLRLCGNESGASISAYLYLQLFPVLVMFFKFCTLNHRIKSMEDLEVCIDIRGPESNANVE